jgi:cobalt-zinc-cadmium efflux system protein
VAKAIGILILTRGGRSSVNMRAAFLEVVNDTLGSVAVLVAATVIVLTGWQQADAVASLFIAVPIIPRTLKLLRETVSVLLESTPPGMDLEDIRRHLAALPHVLEVHDLHASQITSGLPVLSAHVMVEDFCFLDGHAPQILANYRTAWPSTLR